MKLRKAILLKVLNMKEDIIVFVHKFGFDADNESVAIVETEKGDIITVFAERLQFVNSPIVEEKKLPLTKTAEGKLRYLYKIQNLAKDNQEFTGATLDLLKEWSGVFPF